jgi:hypothetical protein
MHNSLVNKVYKIFKTKSITESVIITDLPVELQQKIQKAVDDYKSGNYITHEDMKQKVQQWLSQ